MGVNNIGVKPCECEDIAGEDVVDRASKIGFGKYINIRLEEMGAIGGATGADPREKYAFSMYVEE
jgi:hypothetical protein